MSVGVVNKQTGERIQTAGDPLDKVGNLANLTTTAKGSAVEAINEVNAGLATKADLTDLAPAFSTSTAYTVGQYVSYDGNIYKCTSAHSAGAWVAGDFTLVAVGSELSEINSNLTNLIKSKTFNFVEADITNNCLITDIPTTNCVIGFIVTDRFGWKLTAICGVSGSISPFYWAITAVSGTLSGDFDITVYYI